MELEVGHGETEVYPGFKLEAVRLIKVRGVSYVQAPQDLNVHVSQLRDWVKKFSDDPQHAFDLGSERPDGAARRADPA
jgi:transposase-like protein